MTREHYIAITNRTRRTVAHLPGGTKMLSVPTVLCAACYLVMLAQLAWQQDERVIRAALVPASVFVLVTVLRPLIHRQRPYDRFGVEPVGSWQPNKGKSMPSRHAASAAAIAFSVMWVHPSASVILFMGLLCAGICMLRVLTGKHYPSDVAVALLIAGAMSLIGYTI